MIQFPGLDMLESLYSGRHSLVFRVQRRGESFILKYLNYDYPSTDIYRSFVREFETLCQVRMPGVVEAVSLEKYRNSLYILFRDRGGRALSSILSEEKSFSLSEFFSVSEKILGVLQKLHSVNLIHRDLKPQNLNYSREKGELEFLDFGSASFLFRESQSALNINQFQGSAAYISPEQTGRMNRTVDYRSDYYSLGITFYQMLSGVLPFESNEIMEMIHFHIAVNPVPLKERNAAVPESLSDLVMKLMKKNPEDRYQSAEGILYDLKEIQDNFQKGRSGKVQIGRMDFSSKFQIPEKLYGREKEIERIIECFNDSAKGHLRIASVSGQSGIGKSALVSEIIRPITEKKGFFAFGKYDQFKRDLPYSAIVKAFTDLVRLILSESQETVFFFRKTIQDAAGLNGKILTDLIPELVLLIGDQPEVEMLPPEESLNRFNLVFLEFVNSICTKNHPITVFLDDLQWADLPSIKLLERILSDYDSKYLFIMISFRDNEVFPGDPLFHLLAELDKLEFPLERIELKPLNREDIAYLLKDVLTDSEKSTAECAEVLLDRTQGNPFFVRELLRIFHEKGYIFINEGKWKADVSKIQSTEISDNAVGLIVEKIGKMPEETVRFLKFASCLGDSFQKEILFRVMGLSLQTAERILTESANEGLFAVSGDSVQFTHDKVREAVYSLIPNEERSVNHYKIGRMYFEIFEGNELEENIFTVVNQLNKGLNSIQNDSEKQEILDLNILAGRKSLSSSAFDAAFLFFKAAETLVPKDFWSSDYTTAISFYSDKALSEYLSSDYGSAEMTLEIISKNAKTVLDRVVVYELRAAIFTSRNSIKESIQFLNEALNSLGMHIPGRPSKFSPLPEIAVHKMQMGRKKIKSLLSLPLMKDRNSQVIMKLLNAALAPAFIAQPELFPVLVIKMVNLSLKKGLNYLSPFAFSAFGIIQGSGLGDYQKGYEYGETAVALLEHLGTSAKPMECRTLFMFAVMICHWKLHASESRSLLFRAIQSGVLYGDMMYASYSINHINLQSLLMRNSLEKVLSDYNAFKPSLRKLGQHDAFLLYLLVESFASILSGESKDSFSFSSTEMNEEASLSEWIQADNRMVLFVYYTLKSELYYFAGDFEKACRFSSAADSFEFAVLGMMLVPEHIFFNTLIISELLKIGRSTDRFSLRRKLKKNLKRMKIWAENCPANYGHKYYIMMGLYLESSGKESEAFPYYEKASESANLHEYFLESYLSGRFLAAYWQKRGNERYAEIHLKDAYSSCQKWGCGLIIKQMENEFPFLKMNTSDSAGKLSLSLESMSSSSAGIRLLDLDTVLKASQVLSGEIQLSRLLEKMMKLIFENAGAERGSFLLKQDDVWKVYAKAESGLGAYVLEGIELNSSGDPALENMSLNVINYVTRSGNHVLLNDASKSMFSTDEYIIKNNIKSVLCYPVRSQGKLIGTVYLENSLTSDAFTPDRVELLRVLSAQTAVSLENSILYSSLERKVEERTRSLEYANAELEKLAQSRLRLSAVGEMVSGLVHDIKNPIGTVKAFAEMVKDSGTDHEQREEYADLILRETDRLGDIAYEILDFSKGNIALNLNHHNFAEFLDEIFRFLKIDFEYADIPFSVNCDYEGRLCFDRDRLRRVIVNLANNSREAMSQWKGERKFMISAEKQDDTVLVRVEDTGPGVPKTLSPRLFEAFATEGKTKGTGLGLYMSRMIVEQHNGSISCSPYEGSGAVFIIKIPIQNQEKKL